MTENSNSEKSVTSITSATNSDLLTVGEDELNTTKEVENEIVVIQDTNNAEIQVSPIPEATPSSPKSHASKLADLSLYRLKILTETESDLRTAISIVKLRLEKLRQETEKREQLVKSLEIENKNLRKRKAELTEHLIEAYEKRLLGDADL